MHAVQHLDLDRVLPFSAPPPGGGTLDPTSPRNSTAAPIASNPNSINVTDMTATTQNGFAALDNFNLSSLLDASPEVPADLASGFPSPPNRIVKELSIKMNADDDNVLRGVFGFHAGLDDASPSANGAAAAAAADAMFNNFKFENDFDLGDGAPIYFMDHGAGVPEPLAMPAATTPVESKPEPVAQEQQSQYPAEESKSTGGPIKTKRIPVAPVTHVKDVAVVSDPQVVAGTSLPLPIVNAVAASLNLPIPVVPRGRRGKKAEFAVPEELPDNIDPTLPPKKIERILRNRHSAYQSRARKRIKSNTLEVQVQLLEAEVQKGNNTIDNLEAQNAALREEVEFLRKTVESMQRRAGPVA